MTLEGKVSLATGTSSGIGRAIALALAREGAKVAINYRSNKEGALGVEEKIKAMEREAMAVKADVAKSDQVEQMVKMVVKNFGEIDILVNNAGIYEAVKAEEILEKEWDDILDANLKGVFLCSQNAGKKMIEQRRGKIINIASLCASIVSAIASYCASKAGVILLTKVLAVEWAKYNINVNAVSPGDIRTRTSKTELQDPKISEDVIRKTPLGEEVNLSIL